MTDPLAFPAARHRVRVGELLDSHYVKVICRECGHIGIIPPAWLRARFDGDVQIAEIAPKFKCRECGLVGQRFWDAWVDESGQLPDK